MRNIKHLFSSLLIMLVMANVAVAQNKDIKEIDPAIYGAIEMKFSEGKWADIVALAKKEKKYIFVDAYASWCGPCKLLKSTTFKEKEVVHFFNKNFINVTIDMEKGEGELLAEEWEISAYPTLLFFNPEGKVVMQEIGFLKGDMLLKIGQQALSKK